MKLTATYDTLIKIEQALLALDGTYEKVLTQGKETKIFNAHYELSRRVRIANGSRLHSLEPKLKLYRKEEQAILMKYGETSGDEFRVPGKNMTAFNKENQELRDQVVEGLEIEELKLDDLDLEKNPTIGGQIISMLEPITEKLVDEREKPEAAE